jgi:hypothetical protein
LRPGCDAAGPFGAGPVGFIGAAFDGGFFGSSAIADSDTAAEIDMSGTRTIKRLSMLMTDTPDLANCQRFLAQLSVVSRCERNLRSVSCLSCHFYGRAWFHSQPADAVRAAIVAEHRRK